MKFKLMIRLFLLAGLLSEFAPVAQAFYNPATGRWLSRDPIEETGGVNLYTMVRNNLVEETDALGLVESSLAALLSNLVGFCWDKPCNAHMGALVLNQLREAGIDGNDDRGGGNAFRHCLATCYSARNCGEAPARRFWNGRENPGTTSGRQDLANNEIGFGLAPQAGRCWQGCEEAWDSGQLTCGGGVPCPPRNPPPARQ